MAMTIFADKRFLMWGCVFLFCFCFQWSRPLFVFLFMSMPSFQGRQAEHVICRSSKVSEGKIRGNSPVLELNWKDWFIHFNVPFESKHSLKTPRPRRLCLCPSYQMSLSHEYCIMHMITPTRTHRQIHTPFSCATLQMQQKQPSRSLW